MAKPSHDQKRKKKRAEEKRKASQHQSLAYLGAKYQIDELVPTFVSTEIGIHEIFVLSDRTLLDRTVEKALTKLITIMRAGPLPTLPDNRSVRYEADREEDLLIENVLRNWANHFDEDGQPAKADLIGVLRTTLGSIERMRTPGVRSQSYLIHIAGFLTKKLGVSVQTVSARGELLPEPDEGKLVRLGRRWITDRNSAVRAEFLDFVAFLMQHGLAHQVSDDCHLLLSELSDPSSPITPELIALIHEARANSKKGSGFFS